MTLNVFPTMIQGTDEWHTIRRGLVTASTVGKLITIKPPTGLENACPECDAAPDMPCLSKLRKGGEYLPIKSVHQARTALLASNNTPFVLEVANNDTSRGLTALLTAERITNHTDLTFLNDDMLRGIEDEPRAVDNYSEHFAPVETIGFMVRDDWGFKLGYSPDGLVGDDGLVEVKSRRQKAQLTTVISETGVPDEVMAQLQCGLLVSGRQWIDYISYSGGMALWVKRVMPDPRWFEAITAATETFERTAADMIAAYNKATEGLPLTQRLTDLEMVI